MNQLTFMKKFILVCSLASFVISNSQSDLPNVNLKTLTGKSTSIKKIAQKNELIIISLWATWCVPCKNELDAVAEVYDEWMTETDVVYYAVSIDDSRTSKRIKPMVNGKDWEFEILLDENSDLKRAFGVSTVPYTTIIKNGRVVYKHTGYTPGYEDELYNQLLKFSNQ